MYSFKGEQCVEFLNGPSPVEEIDGEKKYTVPNDVVKKKKKTKPAEEEEPQEEVDSLSFKSRFKSFFLRIVSSSLFEGFIIFCIMLNTILMASEHYKMPTALEKTIEVCNYVSLNYVNCLVCE